MRRKIQYCTIDSFEDNHSKKKANKDDCIPMRNQEIF